MAYTRSISLSDALSPSRTPQEQSLLELFPHSHLSLLYISSFPDLFTYSFLPNHPPFFPFPLNPLSAQVNDPTPRCREAAADVIASLARRVDPDIVSTFIRYAMKWLSSCAGGSGSAGDSAQARALVRTGSQVAGLMVTTRPDLFKKLGFVMQAVASVRSTLVTLLRVMEGSGEKRGSLEKRETSKHDEGQGDGGGAESWAVSYHLLVLIEKYVVVHLIDVALS